MREVISIFISFTFLLFSSKTLAQNACRIDISIVDLKEKLINLQKEYQKAEMGIVESDRILTKTQEIILLARAKGNKKAGQVAEEALKQAEEAKKQHMKNKEQIELDMAKLNGWIKIAERNNLKSLSEICNKLREQVEHDKIALKRFVKEAEDLSKRQEEREKEIVKEKMDFVIDYLTTSFGLIKEFQKQKNYFGRLEMI
jgi:esterase/lipase